jgi:HK97 family phage prohead protease
MRIEIRSDHVLLDGYINVTQRDSRELSSPRGPFVEQIMPRTFEKALMANPNVDLLFNHDEKRKLGSTTTGELELREDNIGLRGIAKVTDPEVISKARAGELQGWSFGFQSLKDSWENRENAVPKRTVEEMWLGEVSILDRVPAYIATSIESRSGDKTIVAETRGMEFSASFEDNSEPKKETKLDEKREVPDFSNFEKEIEFLKLKGVSA